MHVVGNGLAPIVKLVSLNERSWKWIVFLKFEVTWSFIVTESTGYSEVFTTCVKDNLSWLTVWRSHVDSSHIDGIISACQWHLKLQIISIIFSWRGNLGHQLLLTRFRASVLTVVGIGSDWLIKINFSGWVNIQTLFFTSLLLNEHSGFFLFEFREWFSNVTILDITELSVRKIVLVFNH